MRISFGCATPLIGAGGGRLSLFEAIVLVRVGAGVWYLPGECDTGLSRGDGNGVVVSATGAPTAAGWYVPRMELMIAGRRLLVSAAAA